MIGTQTPFRISFAGGGSDLAEFYTREPGCVLSTTINKYMYILVHPFFEKKIHLKYSKTELVETIDQVQHPIMREALRKFDLSGIDINSIADIPAGTGLGSSSSFTVGLLHALYAYAFKYPSKERLASEACEIEIDILKEPIGKQDQYAAAYGGLNFITFYPNGSVGVEPIRLREDKHDELQDNLLMFYLGSQRKAGDILKHQRDRMMSEGKSVDALRKMTALAKTLRDSLVRQNLDDFGSILHEGWVLKQSLSEKISSSEVDHYYSLGTSNGAMGGKLLGAGGSGFLLFYCKKENQDQLRTALGLREIKFRFDTFGSKVFYSGESTLDW